MVLPEYLSYQHFKRLDQTKLAAELDMAQSSASKAMAELLAAGVLEKRGAGPVIEWRLSSDYGWRGDVAGFHAFNRAKADPAEQELSNGRGQLSQNEYYANSGCEAGASPTIPPSGVTAADRNIRLR